MLVGSQNEVLGPMGGCWVGPGSSDGWLWVQGSVFGRLSFVDFCPMVELVTLSLTHPDAHTQPLSQSQLLSVLASLELLPQMAQP